MSQKQSTEQRFNDSIERAFRSLAIRAENVESAKHEMWTMQTRRKFAMHWSDGTEINRNVYCSKTGRCLRQLKQSEVAHVVELHGEESAREFLYTACVDIALEWRFEKPETLKQLARRDPAAFYVFALSRLTQTNEPNSRDSARDKYEKALAKHRIYRGIEHRANSFAKLTEDSASAFHVQANARLETLTMCNEYARRILALTSPKFARLNVGVARLRDIADAFVSHRPVEVQGILRDSLMSIIQSYLTKNRNHRRTFAKYGVTRQTLNSIALEFNGDMRFARSFYDGTRETSETYDMLEFMMLEGFDKDIKGMAEDIIGDKAAKRRRIQAKKLKAAVEKQEAGSVRHADSSLIASFDSSLSIIFGDDDEETDKSDVPNNLADTFVSEFENLEGFQILDAEQAEQIEQAEQTPQTRPKNLKQSLASLDFSSTGRNDSANIFASLKK